MEKIRRDGLKMTKTKRKCPKNKCENSYLRQVKETKKIKKELICLKCQHTWTTAAKYAKEIKIANSEELATLKEITDAIHKQYEKVRKMVNHESSLTDLPVDPKSKIKIGSASGVKSKGDLKVIIYDDLTKEIPKPKKANLPIKGDFAFEQVTTQVTRAHKPVIEIERVKIKKWFKPWTWF